MEKEKESVWLDIRAQSCKTKFTTQITLRSRGAP